MVRAGGAAQPARGWATLAGLVTTFKAEQVAVMPEGGGRNTHFASKVPTVNVARDKGAKELPKSLPSTNHRCALDLLHPPMSSQSPFESAKLCPSALFRTPELSLSPPAPGCAPQSCARGSALPFPHRWDAPDLGKDPHKMPRPLKSPKEGLSKTSVMPGMSFPAMN